MQMDVWYDALVRTLFEPTDSDTRREEIASAVKMSRSVEPHPECLGDVAHRHQLATSFDRRIDS